MYIYEETAYEELDHIIMESKKSHDCLASWIPRKTGGIIHSECKGLSTESNEDRISMSQLKQSGRKDQILPSSAFFSSQALKKLHDTHPHSEGKLLYRLPTHMLISPRKTLTDTLRGNVPLSVWEPCDLVKLTCKN